MKALGFLFASIKGKDLTFSPFTFDGYEENMHPWRHSKAEISIIQWICGCCNDQTINVFTKCSVFIESYQSFSPYSKLHNILVILLLKATELEFRSQWIFICSYHLILLLLLPFRQYSMWIVITKVHCCMKYAKLYP